MSNQQQQQQEVKVQQNLENICDIGLNIFNDDLETLLLLKYSYQYVYRQLSYGKYETLNLDIYQQLRRQETLLTDRMLIALKDIENNCDAQLMLHDKYGDPLLLGSTLNTIQIKQRVKQYLYRCRKYHYDGKHIMQYIDRLLLSIQAMGVKVEISAEDEFCLKEAWQDHELARI